MKNNISIQFLNHASFIVSDGNISVLTDPWYRGSVFNNAWNLLYENNYDEISRILEKIDYIWISHEHPDHFSIDFFKYFKSLIIKHKIKVLFQTTLDQRVINFLNVFNIPNTEMKENEYINLSENFKVKTVKDGFYDSALILNISDSIIFNLNDCAIRSKKQVTQFKNKYGKCDVLLSQFSYAAWKGGKEKIINRINSAKEKINSIKNQILILEPDYFIPIASLIWFSHSENYYMNDSINKIHSLHKLIDIKPVSIIVMQPYEKQYVNSLLQKKDSLDFWKLRYENIAIYKKNNYSNPPNEGELKNNFDDYKKAVFQKNSFIFMYIFHLVSFKFLFSDLKIHLNDLDKTLIFNFFKDLKVYKGDDYDISLHSNSLIFIFKNTFGFDTLTVNGLFEVNSFKGFRKMVYNFGIGNLNNMGFSFNLKLFFNFKLIFFTLKTYYKSIKII